VPVGVVTLALAMGAALSSLLTRAVSEWGGWQLALRFATLHPETRVLYMTGYTETPALPGVQMLQKPFTAFSLLQAVGEAVDRQPEPQARS